MTIPVVTSNQGRWGNGIGCRAQTLFWLSVFISRHTRNNHTEWAVSLHSPCHQYVQLTRPIVIWITHVQILTNRHSPTIFLPKCIRKPLVVVHHRPSPSTLTKIPWVDISKYLRLSFTTINAIDFFNIKFTSCSSLKATNSIYVDWTKLVATEKSCSHCVSISCTTSWPISFSWWVDSSVASTRRFLCERASAMILAFPDQ